MKISIKNLNKEYQLNIQPLTQLCGTDFYKKEFIIQSMRKYFSSKKYMEYEEKYWDNIRVEDENVGRKYFDLSYISSREDFIEELGISKLSFINQCILNEIQSYDLQCEISKINGILENVYTQLNREIFYQKEEIEIGYESNDIFHIVQKSLIQANNGERIESLANINLIENFLVILKKIQNIEPKKRMIIIDNVDHLLTYDEYKKIYNECRDLVKVSDTWIIFTSSIDGYAILDSEYEGINIINDVVYNLPSFERIISYIKENYPSHWKFENTEIMESIRWSIHRIGRDSRPFNVKSEVIIKMINQSLCVDNNSSIGGNSLEFSFLMGSNMV